MIKDKNVFVKWMLAPMRTERKIASDSLVSLLEMHESEEIPIDTFDQFVFHNGALFKSCFA